MVTFRDYGIEIPQGESGQIRIVCPECTPGRKLEHQNEKDLAVNLDEQTWYCHHCGWSGALKKRKDTKKEYVKPEYKPVDLPQGVIDWFNKRRISEKTLSFANIGYQPSTKRGKGAIMFPRYKDGEVVAIKYRTYDKTMWQSTNPEPCFYNYDGAKRTNTDTLIITEGEIDALSFLESGIPNVASVPDGAPNPNAKNLSNKLAFLKDGLIDKFKYFVLAVDDDEPGKFLEGKLAEHIGKHKCLRVNYPSECKDANDVLVKIGPEKLKEVCHNAKAFPIDGLYTTEDVKDAVIDLYKNGLKPGLGTGWESVNEYYTVRICELTVVTGIPGSGKSTWLDALTVNMNNLHDWKIAYCSPENWPIQRHIANLIEKISAKPFAKHTFTAHRLTQEELESAMNKMNGNFFFTQLHDDEMHIDGVLEVMQAAISRYGVKGIVLDPWNELEYHRPSNLTETEFVSQALGKIRRFARMNNAHIWIVAHPTKLKRNEDGTYPVPRLYDISGSAHWYNKADNGIAIYRRDPKVPQVEIHVQKIRFREIGQIGSTTLNYVKDTNNYVECVDGEKLYPTKKQEKDDVPF